MAAVIREATGEDFDRILEFMKETETLSDRVHDHLESYFLMENTDQELIATAGMKLTSSEGVVRTLVIDSKRCNIEDVIQFISSLLSYAEKKGLHTLYIVTLSPELFTAFDFVETASDEVPGHLIDQELLDRSVGAGAIFMMKSYVQTHSIKQ